MDIKTAQVGTFEMMLLTRAVVAMMANKDDLTLLPKWRSIHLRKRLDKGSFVRAKAKPKLAKVK